MILYVNDKGEIRAINQTEDTSLTAVEIDDNSNPFVGWSQEKICCFRIGTSNGRIIFFTEYIDRDLVERISSLSNTDAVLSGDVVYTQLGLAETYEKVVDTEGDVTDIELAITELYELMLGGV